jgi:hypothetical protein
MSRLRAKSTYINVALDTKSTYAIVILIAKSTYVSVTLSINATYINVVLSIMPTYTSKSYVLTDYPEHMRSESFGLESQSLCVLLSLSITHK